MSLKDQETINTSAASVAVSSKAALEQKLTDEYRLCHMVKRSDFDGYGFNLHSEKGKPGQYIGKVDEKSPAESSGLRQGDRIIEVNGVNIGHETHKQVVQRIKAIENEVRLLVIDPDIETRIRQEHEKENETAAIASGVAQQSSTTTTTNNNNSTAVSPTASTTTTTSSSGGDKDEHPNQQATVNNNNNNNNNNTNNNSNNSRNSISTVSSIDSSSNGGHETTATLTATPSPSPPALKSNPIVGSDSAVVQNNGTSNGTSKSSLATSSSTATSTSATATAATGLNLKMTAAEMRAKLQARKKYDPKNDSVDLRKKFDIIQKL